MQTNSTALVDTETEQGMPETLYKTEFSFMMQIQFFICFWCASKLSELYTHHHILILINKSLQLY